jgi:hypothetical protein
MMCPTRGRRPENQPNHPLGGVDSTPPKVYNSNSGNRAIKIRAKRKFWAKKGFVKERFMEKKNEKQVF